MVTIVVLNVLFAIVGLLIAVGIPVAGLFWQAREETAPAVRQPVALGGLSAPRQRDAPAPPLSSHPTDRAA